MAAAPLIRNLGRLFGAAATAAIAAAAGAAAPGAGTARVSAAATWPGLTAAGSSFAAVTGHGRCRAGKTAGCFSARVQGAAYRAAGAAAAIVCAATAAAAIVCAAATAAAAGGCAAGQLGVSLIDRQPFLGGIHRLLAGNIALAQIIPRLSNLAAGGIPPALCQILHRLGRHVGHLPRCLERRAAHRLRRAGNASDQLARGAGHIARLNRLPPGRIGKNTGQESGRLLCDLKEAVNQDKLRHSVEHRVFKENQPGAGDDGQQDQQ